MEQNLETLFTLETAGENCFSPQSYEVNLSGRAYGGQLMALAVRAAYATVGPERRAHLVQVLFSQGTRVDIPAKLQVTPLLDGKRFSGRHVRLAQEDRICLDAQISFQVPMSGPHHEVTPSFSVLDPDDLASSIELADEYQTFLARLSYSCKVPSGIEVKAVDPKSAFSAAFAETDTFCFWGRVTQALPVDASMFDAALVYLSDLWTGYAAIGCHTPQAGKNLYTATLNHSIWIYGQYQPTEWLFVVSHRERTGGGRGTAVSKFYTRDNRLLATVAQEILVIEEI